MPKEKEMKQNMNMFKIVQITIARYECSNPKERSVVGNDPPNK